MTNFRLKSKTGVLTRSFLLCFCLFANFVFAQENRALVEENAAANTTVTETAISGSNSSAEQQTITSPNQTKISAANASNNNSFTLNKTPSNLNSKTAQSNAENNLRAGVQLANADDDGIEDAIIDTNLLRVVISSKTGCIASYYLKGKNFEESIVPSSVHETGTIINEAYVKNFASNVVDTPFNGGYSIAIDKQDEKEIRVRATANQTTQNGQPSLISLSKIYIFKHDSYSFVVDHLLTNLGNNVITVGNDTVGGLSMEYGPGMFMKPYTPSQIVALHKDDRSVKSFLKASDFKPSNCCGVGIKDQYFCVLIETNDAERVEASDTTANNKNQEIRIQKIKCIAPKFNLNAGETKSVAFNVYAGPMLLDYLTPVNLSSVSEYGFLSTILMRILQFFYTLVPNYGIAIILLTILVRVVLYPLTLKQTKSMAAMQRLAPKMQDIKDRYKDDPQKMNEEILKLYQKNNVNPVGGCLPLLLQMPILIALYNTIRIAVELRKTQFLWMPDLSQSDPYIILPIAIAVLMYVQSATQPGQANMPPEQKQMMTIMPMMMFVITWSLPAGLLVYWFASSILGILQQKHANKLIAAMKEEKE